jgi:hypothetical protein
LSAQTTLYRRVPLEKPPEELAGHARDILQSVGYSEPPVDTAVGFDEGFDEGKEFLRYIAEHDKSKTRWDNLETGALEFWYRGSPQPLEAHYVFSYAPILGFVMTFDPPVDVSGMTLLRLTPRGHLTQLIVVPQQVEKPAAVVSPPDWTPLFAAAGLDPSNWPPAQPTWTPPVYGDARAAWTGALGGRPDIPMRIEAAAYRGKPVYFELIGPWTRPDRMQPYQPTVGERVFLVILAVLLVASVVGGALLARRNLHLGRGDRRGAARLAAFVFAAWVVAVFFGAHHILSSYELWLFVMALVLGAAWSGFTWLLYIALEPFVRRRWPAALISWSRLLAGGFRDSLVGRDVLVGCLLAAFSVALGRLGWFVPSWLGYAPPQPSSGPRWQFLGARTIISDISLSLGPVLLVPLGILFVLFLLRALLRKEAVAAFAFVLLFTVLFSAGSQFDPVVLVTQLVFWVLAVFLLMRFGLLAWAVQGIFDNLLEQYPLTTHGSAWYAGISLAAILLMAAIALYGFYTSLGGRPVFGGAVLEE